MHYDAVIIGAGPGGLACAAKLAEGGITTLLVERKTQIGPKVCAGGITWSGLIKTVPASLIEQAFPRQFVQTPLQKVCIIEQNPVIATVNRTKLGQFMAQVAHNAGATIITATCPVALGKNSIDLLCLSTQKRLSITYDFLIGADGSSSMVRRSLGLTTEKRGIGLNYQFPGSYEKMEWHLNQHFFNNGYGWIFPHKRTISIGAYISGNRLSSLELKKRLIAWARENHFELSREKCTAGYINYDFQGWQFDNVFLVGDAAGFASALTGEGIYPAIISGQSVAEKIISPSAELPRMKQLEKKQRLFSRLVGLTDKNSFLSALLAEIGALALRSKMIDFTSLEMGNDQEIS